MKQVDWGIVLFSTIYIGNGDAPAGTLLDLRINPGEPMNYYAKDNSKVDFPGEYELSWYRILALSKPNSMLLNYIISFQDNKVAFIQDKKILQEDDITDMDTRYITDETIGDAIEKWELEWEIVTIELS